MNDPTTTTLHSTRLSSCFGLLLLLLLWGPSVALAQDGTLVRKSLYSESLKGSLTDESPDRNVIVYLPPSYASSPAKSYPVIYLLHGILDRNEVWTRNWSQRDDNWGTIKGVMDGGIAERMFGEMIVVMPDQFTRWGGSFYTNSPVTGNWEDFTVRDLVNHVDRSYRTLPEASSRGIAGHSMGGYGAITLAMKHPDVYSVVYAMNPALLGWGRDVSIDNPAFASVLEIKSAEEAIQNGLYVPDIICVGQAFSPNPAKPPFYVDFPFALVGGKLQPSEPGFSRWQQSFPVNRVGDYRSSLAQLRGLKFDSGYEVDFTHIPPTARAFFNALTAHGIEHVFEEYNGDHRNRPWGRIGRIATEVMPYGGYWIQRRRPIRNSPNRDNACRCENYHSL